MATGACDVKTVDEWNGDLDMGWDEQGWEKTLAAHTTVRSAAISRF